MANVDIATTLIQFLAQNPSLITQFLSHPYSVTQEATGAEEQLSQTDMSEVVTAAAALSTGQNVDLSNLSGVASALLSQNGGSVHTLTNALFGTPEQANAIAQQQQQQASVTSGAAQPAVGLDLGTLVSLAGALMGSSTPAAQQQQPTGASLINFSDGIDVKDVIGLASLFLSNK